MTASGAVTRDIDGPVDADFDDNSQGATLGQVNTGDAATLANAKTYADAGDAASVAHTVSAGTGLSGGGAISTNPTLTVTTPLTEANLRATAAGLTANLAVNGKKVTNVGSPTAGSTDAATAAYAEQYAQSLAWGIASKVPARFATTAPLADAYDYLNGVAGVGATLTKHTAGAFPTIDGITPQLLDRVLIKDETGGNAPYNGVYFISALGSGLLPWSLTRTLDTDTSAELAGAAVDVQVGTANVGKRFVFLADGDTFVIGTNNVTFTQTSPGLSGATPQPLGTAASGSSGVASRDDHVHQTPIYNGTGSPNGVVSAPVGSLFIQTDAPGAMWAKTSGAGNTGWSLLKGGVGTYVAGTTTPDVTGVGYLAIANSVPTNITNFLGAVAGQVLVLEFRDANTTVTQANAVLPGGTSFVGALFRTLTLVKSGAGSLYWTGVANESNS